MNGVGAILDKLILSFLALEMFSGTYLPDNMSVKSQFLAQLFGVVLTNVWTLIFAFVSLKIASVFTSLGLKSSRKLKD